MGKKTAPKIALPAMPAEIEALATSVAFTGATSLALAGRMILAKHTRKLYEHLPGVLSGDDPHAIHQMRVATRRLRASLESTALAYKRKRVDTLRKRLRKLARALGAVRDRDVMLIRLVQDMDQPGIDRGEIEERTQLLQAERDAAHQDLVAELHHKRSQRLLDDLNDFLLCPLQEVTASDDDLPLLVRHHAGSAIWHEYETVLRFETAMPRAESELLHELRIASKHLRYTLELFEPALGDDSHGLIKQVEDLQEHLGLIHDADVALAYFGLDRHSNPLTEPAPPADSWQDPTTVDQAQEQSPNNGGVLLAAQDSDQIAHRLRYVDLRLAEQSRLLAEVAPMWEQLVSKPTRRKLGKLVALL